MKSIRISAIAEYLNENDKIADIGCDHGYLAIEAINKGCQVVQLIDNKEGPLSAAKRNLKNYEKKAKVVYTLGDGLKDVLNEIDTFAICGMGGDLICKILSDSKNKISSDKKLILQANSKNYQLRMFLMKENIEILSEKIVCENDKIYEIIFAQKTDKLVEYSFAELQLGPTLMKEKNNVFMQKWTKYLKLLEEIIKNTNDDAKKVEYQMIKEVLNDESK